MPRRTLRSLAISAYVIFRCLSGKESICQCRRLRRHRSDTWDGKIPWSRTWLPTPVLLPGKFRGQRSLAGYCPWGHKELDMTERLTDHTHTGGDRWLGRARGKICTVQGRYVDEPLGGKDQERTLWQVTSAKKGDCVWATYKVLCTSWAAVTLHACKCITPQQSSRG